MTYIYKVFNNKMVNITDYIHNFQVSHYNTRINDVTLPSIRIEREKQSVVYQGLILCFYFIKKLCKKN